MQISPSTARSVHAASASERTVVKSLAAACEHCLGPERGCRSSNVISESLGVFRTVRIGGSTAAGTAALRYFFNPRTKLSMRARPFSMFAMLVA
jgi:hypothetical protein